MQSTDTVQMDIQDNTHKKYTPYNVRKMAAPPPVKDGLSYDDILQSLNMRLYEGKLQKIAPVEPALATNHPIQNSYIHNKYFKNQIQKEAAPVKQMTRQEYIQWQIAQHNEAIDQKARIRQVKSKKLLFNNGNNHGIRITHSGDLNKLFHFR